MQRISGRPALAAALALAAAAVYVAPAEANRPASGKERRGLTAAVHATNVAGLGQVPQSHYRVTGQRVSTVSADVGCGIAPNKVLADLFKTKTPCPAGGIG